LLSLEIPLKLSIPLFEKFSQKFSYQGMTMTPLVSLFGWQIILSQWYLEAALADVSPDILLR